MLPKSSIGRKKFVAVTGLLLLGFLAGHLAGNLLIFKGPETFNAYAHKLASLRPALYLVEIALAAIFVGHAYVTVKLVKENRKARRQRYAVQAAIGDRTLSNRLMPFTGAFILIYLFVHIYDFTFDGFRYGSVIAGYEGDFELYGVVYNAFSHWIHSALYVLAMICLGFHLTHAIQSLFRTFGWYEHKCFPYVVKGSIVVGILVAVAYSTIPALILMGVVKPG